MGGPPKPAEGDALRIPARLTAVGRLPIMARMVGFVVTLAVLGAMWIGARRLFKYREQKRLATLTDTFGAEAAARITRGEVWLGATRAMVAESIGMPVDVDERVYKTKTKHTYKYAQTGARRFAVRVMFEDGICVGWEDKT